MLKAQVMLAVSMILVSDCYAQNSANDFMKISHIGPHDKPIFDILIVNNILIIDSLNATSQHKIVSNYFLIKNDLNFVFKHESTFLKKNEKVLSKGDFGTFEVIYKHGASLHKAILFRQKADAFFKRMIKLEEQGKSPDTQILIRALTDTRMRLSKPSKKEKALFN